MEQTNINIASISPYDLSLTTSVTPALSNTYYTIGASTIPSQQGAATALTFNRYTGITDNDTWTFSTTFTVDGVSVTLAEQITGTETLPGSTMLQCMTAGTTSTGFQSTNDAQSIMFTGVSGAKYSLTWTLPMDSDGLNRDITYTLTQTQPGYVPIAPVMTQIKTIVFLMLENRSFDNVLGWLHPGADPKVFDGIPAGSGNAFKGANYPVTQGTEQYADPCLQPPADPNEPLPHVQIQLYADGNGTLPAGDIWSQTPGMQGFAFDYASLANSTISEVMGAYDTATLPVLSGLAKSFAVSDRWFSSAPTQTFPNRAFSVCGTSLGNEVNSTFSPSQFANANTLFNALGAAGKTWGLYYQSTDPLGSGVPSTEAFTPYMFPMIGSAQNGGVYNFSDFTSALSSGSLPDFCFIEPYWGGGFTLGGHLVGIQGNDYHPPAWVGPAEASLNDLYQSIVASPQWKANEMLFVITFDEHGGTWDHVPPPTTIPPDPYVGPSGFAFNRLGVRVPTIVVSPYVTPGTVFRAPDGSAADFDHTSFIATFLKWAGIDPRSAGMGDRVAHAPTFEGVLRSTVSGVTPPTFVVPTDYASQGGGVGAILGLGGEKLTATRAMHVADFRRALDESHTPEALDARIRDLIGAAPRADGVVASSESGKT